MSICISATFLLLEFPFGAMKVEDQNFFLKNTQKIEEEQ